MKIELTKTNRLIEPKNSIINHPTHSLIDELNEKYAIVPRDTFFSNPLPAYTAAVKEYHENGRRFVLSEPHIMKLKGEIAMHYPLPCTDHITDDVAEYMLDTTAGYYSDMFTIPLKDIPNCPTRAFRSPVDSSVFTAKQYSKLNVEDLYKQSHENIILHAVKHQDPRYGWFDWNFKLIDIVSESIKWLNPWNYYCPTIAPNTLGLNNLMEYADFYDKGFWYYPIMAVPEDVINCATIDKVDKFTKFYPESTGERPIGLFREYIYYLRCNKYQRPYIHWEEYTKERSKRKHVRLVKSIYRASPFYTIEAAIKTMREAANKHHRLLHRKSEWDIIRCRLVYGKPYYIKDKYSTASNVDTLTAAYNKGLIGFGDNYWMDSYLIDNKAVDKLRDKV